MTKPLCHLVIGYGNELRGDDAAGPLAARAVEQRALPGVQVLTGHQLTPELAAILATAGAAIFVDAYRYEDADVDLRIEPVEPCTDTRFDGHLSDPCGLLALTRALYGHAPQAWLITIPAVALGFGTVLSPVTRRGVDAAVRAIEHMVRMADSRSD
jgi:hydrogenase maturation protease